MLDYSLFPAVTVTAKGEKMLRGGHVWVYADEVVRMTAVPEDGSFVRVENTSGRFLGTGFYNGHSTIRIRIVSKNLNDTLDEPFWRRRLSWAVRYRRDVLSDADFDCCRLVFGEADQFPGLTVDRYHNVLVLEVLSKGMADRRDLLVRLLLDVLRNEFGQTIDTVYERSDSPLRALEGLPSACGYLPGEGLFTEGPGTAGIVENGIRYIVDFVNGQKTGFFLDQKYNRLSVRPLAKNKRVLDACTHTGSFALNAAAGGARSVTALDVSEDALAMAKRHAELNGFADRISFVRADVFEYLDSCLKTRETPFDFIILDPPAFTKSRDTLKNAMKGYLEINEKAMRLLPRGGYLATCSCSHFMTETYFKQMLHNAAAETNRQLRQIEARKQSPDHPILWNVPETDYLKFFLFQVF
ncbi:MAG: class I SAM-dependent rRNA methyltransferase [Clostridia bacterium]|nr:class I SAM-dependent rRNA methyltransferase [Clostridia bacterium]